MAHPMTRVTKIALLAGMLLLGASVTHAQGSVGIKIGPPPFPRIVSSAGQVRPGKDFVWIGGYWYPVEGHYVWRDGYWTRRPYPGADWVPPHHNGQLYFPGYWEGKRARAERDRRSDRDRDSQARIKPVNSAK
jgi:WXXGXW repeat (2 copies)